MSDILKSIDELNARLRPIVEELRRTGCDMQIVISWKGITKGKISPPNPDFHDMKINPETKEMI